MGRPQTVFVSTYQRTKELNQRRFPFMDHYQMNRIIDAVCEAFEVTRTDLKGDNKPFKNVIPRQTAAFFARFEEMKLWYIAIALGYQEHSAVKHGIDQVRDTLLNDPEYVKKFNLARQLINKKDYVWEKYESLKDLDKHF